MDIKSYIRYVENHPSSGILFRDITPLVYSPKVFKYIVDKLCDHINPSEINVICSIDSRGFIFGAPVSYKLSIPFVLLRKKGKLPPDVYSSNYQLEYGSSTLELSKNLISNNSNVALIDDLLATGGSALAANDLIFKSGSLVKKFLFVIELLELNGREKLPKNSNVFTVIKD